MLAIHAEEGEGSGQPSEPQPTPSPDQSFHEEHLSNIPSSSQPQKTQKHRKGRKLSNMVLDLEKAMTAQAKEIAILKKRVKKLEKRKRSRTQGLKLFKMGTSKRRSLDKEDASKHGRNLNARLISEEDDFDAGFDVVRDEGITHVEGDAEQVVIAAAEVVNAGVSVSTAEPKTPPTTTLLEDDDVTVAATLVQMSETSKAKSIVFEDVEESAKEQREGKAPMVEEDVPPPKKTQKQLDDERAGLEEAMRLQAEQEAEHAELIHLDRLLAQRMQEEEEMTEQQKKRQAEVLESAKYYTKEDWDIIRANVESNAELSKILLGENEPGEDFATRMVNLLNQRKKFFAEQRAQARRNRPMTQTQQRTYMSNYLKHQGSWTSAQLKKLSDEEDQEEYQRRGKGLDQKLQSGTSRNKKTTECKEFPCMQTRSSSKFVGEPSTNPTSTIPNRRNRRRSKQRVEPFSLEETPVVTMADQRTMAELLQAPTEGYGDAIVIPAILAENFELKHGLLNLVTSKQFYGFEKEDPHAHIRWFNKITSTIKYKDVPNSSIKLMLFPFSIEGAARIWLEKEPPRSILTWEDLVSKFINQFFPPSKTTNLRNEITNFQQRFDESFCEAWDRFKDLLRACPHHGFTELHQLDTFYNALTPTDQDSLNVAAGGLSPDVVACTDVVKALLLKNMTPPPASVKAVEETAVNYNQGNAGHCPPSVAHQVQPPSFPPVHNNQNRGNNYNPGNSTYRALTPPTAPLNELANYMKL
ncbi:reverse transcriptase domain-containing protein [Tanacetum coccineum]